MKMVIFVVFCLVSQAMMISAATDQDTPWKNLTPSELDIKGSLRTDPGAVQSVSQDFGNMTKEAPAAVLCPSSVQDIASLVKSASVKPPLASLIAARGAAHSVRGQALVSEGVVVNMSCLTGGQDQTRVTVSGNSTSGFYADVGGEQLWIDLLIATLKQGLSPVSWTDYLYLTIGGTLSNAGISGQTFRHGPQINNVLELDVITGKGDLVTCSPAQNPDLFFAVLGGFGQFGVITRARIALDQAPKRAKWVRMIYSDFSAFTRDQEHLISINNTLDYLEGTLLLDNGSPDTSFFPPSYQSKILSLVKQFGILYIIELAKYYDDNTQNTVDKDLEELLKGLSFIPGLMSEKDVTYMDFLNRVRDEELVLRSKGLWLVPHPWLNLFLPKSQILDFNKGVFIDIVLNRNITTGLVLIYPMFRSKWDDRMSVVIPEEDVFYAVGFLHSSGFDNFQEFDDQNQEILRFCDKAGIKVKQYLPHYATQQDWINHFGAKWSDFRRRKAFFDPKMILAPGQKIFN